MFEQEKNFGDVMQVHKFHIENKKNPYQQTISEMQFLNI